MQGYIKLDRIEEIQLIVSDLLCEFERLCKNANIPYSLAGGTLLGAVRHQGFIPWDDDIDVFMLREDYERFVKTYIGAQLSNPNYQIVDGNNGAPGITFARLVDCRARIVQSKSTAMQCLWIDILPLDVIPTELYNQRMLVEQIRKLRKVRLFLNAPVGTGRTQIKRIIKTPLSVIGRWLGLQRVVCRRIELEARRYEDSNATEVAEVVAQGWIKGTCCKATFKNSVQVPFGDRTFSAMPDYNHYLTGQYGDYWELPPEEAREAHKIDVEIAFDQYDAQMQQKLLYYIQRRDIENENMHKLRLLQNEVEKQEKIGLYQ